MYKSKRNDYFSEGGNYETVIGARETLNKLVEGITPNSFDEHQPLYKDDTQFYMRLRLKNGDAHWLVGFQGSRVCPSGWLAVIAAYPTNGVHYKLIVQCSEISSLEEFPPEAIEALPEEKQPFGFAQFTQ